MPAVADPAVIIAAVVGSVCVPEVNVVEVALRFQPASEPALVVGDSDQPVEIDWSRPVSAVPGQEKLVGGVKFRPSRAVAAASRSPTMVPDDATGRADGLVADVDAVQRVAGWRVLPAPARAVELHATRPAAPTVTQSVASQHDTSYRLSWLPSD